MPKLTQVVYTDEKGKPTLRQSPNGTHWEPVSMYGAMSLAECVRLHAALGEMLTDNAADVKAMKEKEEAEPAEA